MKKNIIKTHDFEKTKNKILMFSGTVPKNLTLPEFKERGWFLNIGDHMVTGSEMNCFVLKIQDILINSNETMRSIISEFRDVYGAFESLDKDYIQSIIISIEASEKASVQAAQASIKAIDAQKDILRTIDGLEKTIHVLKEVKESVAADLYELRNDISEIKSNLTIDKDNIDALQQYRIKLGALAHLEEIDTVWNDVQNYSKSLSSLRSQLSSFTEERNLATDNLFDVKPLVKEERGIDLAEMTHKLNISYAIAATALVFTITHLTLNFLGII